MLCYAILCYAMLCYVMICYCKVLTNLKIKTVMQNKIMNVFSLTNPNDLFIYIYIYIYKGIKSKKKIKY